MLGPIFPICLIFLWIVMYLCSRTILYLWAIEFRSICYFHLCTILLWVLIRSLSVFPRWKTPNSGDGFTLSLIFSWMVFCPPADSYSLPYPTASDDPSLFLCYSIFLLWLPLIFFLLLFCSTLLICYLICISHSLVLCPSAYGLVLPYPSAILAF